jgi:hypothetical protein
MEGWKRMLWTLVLVFVVTVLQTLLDVGGNFLNPELSAIELAVNAGIAAVMALVINFALPFIKQYGYVGDGEVKLR